MRMVAVLMVVSVFLVGCAEKNELPEKVPAFNVTFLHYNVNGTHVIKIKSIEKVKTNPKEIKMFRQPPYPGIHIFSIYSKGVSDIAYVPISKEGDSISVYFTYDPNRAPEKGEKVMIVVEVRDARGKTLAMDRAYGVW